MSWTHRSLRSGRDIDDRRRRSRIGNHIRRLVIGIISNGLNLIGLSSFWQLVVKGLIIVLAVIIDTQKGKDSVVKRILRNAKERA